MTKTLAERVLALEAAFRQIACSRMAGLGLLHPRLQVQAIGFATEADTPDLALGVLVTPWFMNLLQLPLTEDAAAALPTPGASQTRRLAGQALDFIGAQEEQVGRYALCSLFSPMADFADQAAAVATAQAVLHLLRPAPAAVAPAPAHPAPARRGFLFGRSAAGSTR